MKLTSQGGSTELVGMSILPAEVAALATASSDADCDQGDDGADELADESAIDSSDSDDACDISPCVLLVTRKVGLAALRPVRLILKGNRMP